MSQESRVWYPRGDRPDKRQLSALVLGSAGLRAQVPERKYPSLPVGKIIRIGFWGFLIMIIV